VFGIILDGLSAFLICNELFKMFLGIAARQIKQVDAI
jgi:hypothetical protein